MSDLSKTSEALVTELAQLAQLKTTRSGDEVLIDMAPKFAALVVRLSADLDAAQRKVVRLTWALVWLTVVLLVVTLGQLYLASRSATPFQPFGAKSDSSMGRMQPNPTVERDARKNSVRPSP